MPENNTWSDLTPFDDDEPIEVHEENWAVQEQVFGKIDLSKVGYSQQIRTVRSEKFDAGQTDTEAKFSMFRDDEGQLICIHASHIQDGVQKPWFTLTHPGHLRQGHATRLADYIIALREEETGEPFPYADAWGDVPMRNAMASFSNKYANNKLNNTP